MPPKRPPHTSSSSSSSPSSPRTRLQKKRRLEDEQMSTQPRTSDPETIVDPPTSADTFTLLRTSASGQTATYTVTPRRGLQITSHHHPWSVIPSPPPLQTTISTGPTIPTARASPSPFAAIPTIPVPETLELARRSLMEVIAPAVRHLIELDARRAEWVNRTLGITAPEENGDGMEVDEDQGEERKRKGARRE